MNEKRRNRLKDAIEKLESASRIIDSVYDQEYDCVLNYPENLQNTDRFEQMEDNLDVMKDAVDGIDAVVEAVKEVIVA